MKGILHLIIVIILLVTASFTILTARLLLDDFQTQTQGIEGVNQTHIDRGQQALGTLDVGFVFLAIMGFVAVVIGAFYVRTHPIFAIVQFIILILLGLIAPTISNFYYEIATTPGMVATANQYPLMTETMRLLPITLLFFGVLVIIVLYAKRGGNEQTV